MVSKRDPVIICGVVLMVALLAVAANDYLVSLQPYSFVHKKTVQSTPADEISPVDAQEVNFEPAASAPRFPQATRQPVTTGAATSIRVSEKEDYN